MSQDQPPQKAELHRHLEGSLRLTTIIDLAQAHGRALPASTPDALAAYAQVLSPLPSLQAVLDAFALFQASFCDADAVARISFEAVEDAARDGIDLLELRFSPGFLAQPAGLDWDEAMHAVRRGVAAASARYPIKVGLIAIISRSLGLEVAADTVAFAVNWRDALVGFDLADGEEDWPARHFEAVVAPLHRAGIPLTVHSGESTPASFIQESIERLNPRRIGHGVSLIHDEALMRQVIARDIAIEMCLTSNVRTQAVPTLGAHPAKELLRRGVAVTLNTDDPGLFDITLSGELALARQLLGFDDASITTALANARRHSFIRA